MKNGGINLRIDPWPADYEGAVQFEAVEIEPSGAIDPAVESTEWRAIQAEVTPLEADLYFVDGVRRVEARVLADVENQIVHGLFGSIGVGCVRSWARKASVEEISIRRFLILGCGLQRSEQIRIGDCELNFEGVSTASNSPADLILQLQNLMRTIEANLAQKAGRPGTCIFVDGPLTYFATPRQEVVGIIKRIYQPYLPAHHFALVSGLSPGSRTPLFAILDGSRNRYSWFQRVAEGRRIDHPLAGILRLEVGAALGLDAARRLADLAAAQLPRFASNSARDPRAPQNLLPVGALEEELKRRLGDPLILRRGIERKLYEVMTV